MHLLHISYFSIESIFSQNQDITPEYPTHHTLLGLGLGLGLN